MAKKKTVVKKPQSRLSVSSSFFSMHKHARWLLVLFVLATIVFLGVSHRAALEQDKELRHLLIKASDDTISWKTYKNPVGKFTIQYPANWKLVESHEKSNRETDDPSEINTAVFSGRDGEIVLQWGPMGFGGACEDQDRTTVMLKEMKTTVCHGIQNGKMYWDQIYPPNQDPAFGARASAIEEETASVVRNIFATLSFDK